MGPISFLEDLSQHKISLVKGKTTIQSILVWLLKLLTIILINISLIMIHPEICQLKVVATKVITPNRHGERVHKIRTFCSQETENNYLAMSPTAMKISKDSLKLLMPALNH